MNKESSPRNAMPNRLTRKERLARTSIAFLATAAVLTALAFEANDSPSENEAQVTSSASTEVCATVTVEAGQGATSVVKEAVREAELSGARSIIVSGTDSDGELQRVQVTDQMVKDLDALEYAEGIGEEVTDGQVIQPNDVFKYCTTPTVSSDGSWDTGRKTATYSLTSPSESSDK